MQKKTWTIRIDGDMNADDRELLSDPAFAKKQPRNILYLDSYEQLHQLLTPSRLGLLQFLMDTEEKPCSVSEIAGQTHRKQEAISRDLAQLKAAGLVELQKNKRFVHPKPICRRIIIELAH